MKVIRALWSTSTFTFFTGILVGSSMFLLYQVVRQTAHGNDRFGSINAKRYECPSWTELKDTQVYGAQSSDAKSLDACKQACVLYAGCDGLDWTPDDDDGARCWLSGAWISGWNNGSAPGATHYILVKDCLTAIVAPLGVGEIRQTSEDCKKTRTWTHMKDTKVINGRANDSPTIHACKSSCLDTPDCNGFDWARSDPTGKQCWLSGLWSTEWYNGTAIGILHFIKPVDCKGYSSSQQVNQRVIAQSVEQLNVNTAQPENSKCVMTQKWEILRSTKVHSGRSNDSPSIVACQSSCIATPGCNGFDWSPEFKIGHRCWLSGTWSTEWNNGTADGVTHFILTHGCEKDSIQQARSSTGCSTLWTKSEKTQAFGSISNSANSIPECQKACFAHPGCNGIGWTQDGADGSHCWLAGTWVYGWNNGSAPGITHFFLTSTC